MIIRGIEVNSPRLETPDVCIIGSGAGGAVLAWELSERGHSVVVLEKGGYHPKEEHTQKEDEMVPLLYKNSGLQLAVPMGIAVAQGSCVGGSTVVNDAVCFRTPPAVLENWEKTYGVEEISTDHMEKHFNRVEERISVSEVQPYELNANSLMLKKGCDALGWASGPNRRNCKQCRQCGLCHLGCHYGTKQSMLETYIPDAVKSHGETVRIYADCAAERIITSGKRAVSVRGTITGEYGKTFPITVKSRLVVVSAGTIASSELLLRSGLYGNGQVGKRIALHPSPAIVADFDQEINGSQGIPMAYHCDEFSVLRTRKRGYLIESLFMAPYQFSLSMPAFDYENKELMARYNHFALAGIMLQDESVGSLALGGPSGAVLFYQLSPTDGATMIEAMKNTARIFFKAGAKRVITSHARKTILYSENDLDLIKEQGVAPLDINLGSGHPQGGNCMGGDPSSSVVDSYGRYQGMRNLFVCDASIFPTSVGVNPQLTVMSLATRAAEHIAENWASGNSYAT